MKAYLPKDISCFGSDSIYAYVTELISDNKVTVDFSTNKCSFLFSRLIFDALEIRPKNYSLNSPSFFFYSFHFFSLSVLKSMENCG